MWPRATAARVSFPGVGARTTPHHTTRRSCTIINPEESINAAPPRRRWWAEQLTFKYIHSHKGANTLRVCSLDRRDSTHVSPAVWLARGVLSTNQHKHTHTLTHTHLNVYLFILLFKENNNNNEPTSAFERGGFWGEGSSARGTVCWDGALLRASSVVTWLLVESNLKPFKRRSASLTTEPSTAPRTWRISCIGRFSTVMFEPRGSSKRDAHKHVSFCPVN